MYMRANKQMPFVRYIKSLLNTILFNHIVQRQLEAPEYLGELVQSHVFGFEPDRLPDVRLGPAHVPLPLHLRPGADGECLRPAPGPGRDHAGPPDGVRVLPLLATRLTEGEEQLATDLADDSGRIFALVVG